MAVPRHSDGPQSKAHLGEELSLTELARVAGFSVSHFKPPFRHAVGMPVHRFVLERRVERARCVSWKGAGA